MLLSHTNNSLQQRISFWLLLTYRPPL
jgi:hypothetical protein